MIFWLAMFDYHGIAKKICPFFRKCGCSKQKPQRVVQLRRMIMGLSNNPRIPTLLSILGLLMAGSSVFSFLRPLETVNRDLKGICLGGGRAVNKCTQKFAGETAMWSPADVLVIPGHTFQIDSPRNYRTTPKKNGKSTWKSRHLHSHHKN